MVRTLSLCLVVATAAACGTYVPQLDEDGGGVDATGGDGALGDAGPETDGGGSAMLAIDDGDNDFGDVLQGSDSAAASFAIRNLGGVASGSLVTALEGDAAEFTLTTDDCDGTVLQPNDSCTVTAIFTPGSTGDLAATLWVSGEPGGAVTAELTGRALAPGALAVDDDSFDYGQIKVALQSAASTFEFTNTGDVDTGALAVSLSNPAFTITDDDCTDAILAPADSCMVAVRFDPGEVGSATGSLTVTGDPGGNSVVALGGTGFAVITVNRSGSGSGGIASTPAGIDCGAICQLSFTTPAVTLTSDADTDNVFSGWTGACTGAGACQLDLDAGDAAVTARFEAMRALTVTRAGNGGGSITSAPAGIDCPGDCSQTYLNASSITLTATPAAGSQPAGWTGCDASTATTCTVAMTAARAVTATFNLQIHAVTVSRTGAGTGTITSNPTGIACPGDCSESWAHGTSITLTAAPTTGSTFAAWTGCDTSSGTSCTVSVNGAENVTADFDLLGYTMTAATAGAGSGTISSAPAGIACPGDCTQTWSHGTSVVLTATPASGSTLSSWSGCTTTSGSSCTVSVDGVESVTATFALQNHLLTAVTSGAGTGTIDSSPAGIACPGDCSQSYTHGSVVTLTAAAGGGSTLMNWAGCDAPSGTTCTVTLDAAETVTAAFELQGFTVGVTTVGNGDGTVTSAPAGIACPGDCSNSYAFGTTVTLTANPATGSSFSGWTGCTTSSGTTCTVSVDGAESVTASFSLNSYLVSVTSGGSGSGTVTSTPAGITCPGDCSQSWNFGASVTLAAAPATGSTFTGWTGCDAPSGATCVVTVSGAENVTASYTLETPALTVSVTGNGTGSVTSAPAGITCPGDCGNQYNHGTSVTLTATPATGSAMISWSGCDTVSTNTCTVSMTSARIVGVVFNKTTHPVTVSTGGNGSGTVTSSPAGINCPGDCGETWNYGQSVTLTATPATGSSFASWVGCDAPSGATCTVSVDGAEAVTANFTLLSYGFTVTSIGAGNGTVTSSPAGINCGGDCNESFLHGTVVTLTEAAATGSTFAGWSGCDSNPSPDTCVVTVNGVEGVAATFTLNSYTMTLGKAGSGGAGTMVTSSPGGINCGADCSQAYAYGTTVVLTAVPPTDAFTDGWTGCTSQNGNTCTVVVDGTETPTVTVIQSYFLSVTKAGTSSGTVTSSPSGISCGTACSGAAAMFDAGTLVTLTQTPASGASFAGWSGACTGGGGCTVTMSQARSVTATFNLFRTLNVTVSNEGTADGRVTGTGINCGQGNTDCTQGYTSTTTVILTRPGNTQCTEFVNWSGACSGTGTTCSVTVAGLTSVTASFAGGCIALP